MLVPGKRLTVYALRTSTRRGAETTIWVRAGTAFVNKDESLNIYLDALPIDGQLHCREYVEKRNGAPSVPPENAEPAEPKNEGLQLAAVGGGM